jgi:poly-gamma-glutamate synthesis protein (capsule biosynthesis protein)
MRPDLRIINLETSVTTSDEFWQGKGINYRMHPKNVPCLSQAKIDHWGGNWGYEIPKAHRTFAHKLIDEAGVDVIHGHSSHHVRPIEVYRGKLILYGCGDFINDYEGIGGYEDFRDDLALMYFPRLSSTTGQLIDLQMTPLQIKRFRLQRASKMDARWLRDTLNRYSGQFGSQVELNEDDRLYLQ